MIFNNISGVILAGGANTRFNGEIKANLKINGRTIISGISDILSHTFAEVIIVTNTPGEFSEFAKCRIVSDEFKEVGPLGGIHASIKASSCEAVFVVAGDMPLLEKKMIDMQTEYFLNNSCDALIPSVNQNIEPLHAIYKITILKKLEEYLSVNSNYAVRDFFNLIDTRYMEFIDSSEAMIAFTNINTPTDFINFKSANKKSI